MPESDETRFDLDPFRGLICLCLVALHFVSTTLHDPVRAYHPALFDLLLWDIRLGVESFFILAGLMVAHNLRERQGYTLHYDRYFGRRGVRLWLPYAVAVLLAAANIWAARLVGLGKSAPSGWDILAQLALVQELFAVEEAAIGFWSLVALEQFYFGWLVILATLQVMRCPAMLIGWCAFALGIVSLVLLDQSRAEGFPDLLVVLPFWLIYIVVGILLYAVVREGRHHLLLGLLLLGLCGVGMRHTDDPRPFKALFSCLVLTVLCRGYRFPKIGIVRFFGSIGKRSYSVYLTHGIVGYRVFSIYPKIAHHGAWVIIALLLVATGLSAVAAMLFYKFVEVPCLSLARRITYRTINDDDASASSGAKPPSPL